MDIVSLAIFGLLVAFRVTLVKLCHSAKIAHYIYHVLYYTGISVFYFVWMPQRNLFEFGVPEDVESFYFMIQLSFYLSGLLFMLDRHSEEKQHKDYHRMVLHHAVTITLICFAIYFRYHVIGAFVMAIHDVGDIFLNAGKLAGRDRGFIYFIPFVFFFVIGRFYYLPIHILAPCFRYAQQQGFPIQHVISLTGLCVLIVLHIFWLRDIFAFMYNPKRDPREKED